MCALAHELDVPPPKTEMGIYGEIPKCARGPREKTGNANGKFHKKCGSGAARG